MTAFFRTIQFDGNFLMRRRPSLLICSRSLDMSEFHALTLLVFVVVYRGCWKIGSVGASHMFAGYDGRTYACFG